MRVWPNLHNQEYVMRPGVNVGSVCEVRGHAECAWGSDAIDAFHNEIDAFHDAIYTFHDAINAFMTQSTHFTTQSTHFATQSTHFTTQSTYFTTQSTHFTTQSTHFTTQSTHFMTQSMHFTTQSTHFMTQLTHFMTHRLEQEQIKALPSYTIHHLNANSEGDNKYTIDMANIHICPTCGKVFHPRYDLRRHENTVHSEDTSSREDEDSNS